MGWYIVLTATLRYPSILSLSQPHPARCSLSALRSLKTKRDRLSCYRIYFKDDILYYSKQILKYENFDSNFHLKFLDTCESKPDVPKFDFFHRSYSFIWFLIHRILSKIGWVIIEIIHSLCNSIQNINFNFSTPKHDGGKTLYRSSMLNLHLVAILPNNIFVIISKTMSFYEKCQKMLFACHKILNKKCSIQFLCKTCCYEEKYISN